MVANYAEVARADVMAGGPVYGYPQQDQLAGCFLYNAGPTAISLTSFTIVGTSGPIQIGQNTCSASLAPSAICGIVGGIGRAGPYACKAVVPNGTGTYLRGAVGVGTLLDPSDITVPLQLTPEG